MVASDSYPLNQGGPLVDPFPPHPPPPPPHHSSYGVYTYSAGPPPPPPSCYNHPPTRGIPFIDPAFQCPCPMQSCPKNVHTGPLTGASKGSSQNIQAQTQQGGQGNQQNNVICLDQQQLNSQEAIPAPLPPVALALPLEPSGANLGPPSPARGSAGMPPPASPALSSTARNPPSWSPPSGHPVPIKEEDITPKELPTPPPEQTIVDIPVTENFLQRRMRPMKRKASIEHEIVMDPMMPMAQVLEQPMMKKRRAASPVLIHELMPQIKRPLNTIKCKEEIPIVNDNMRVTDSIIEDVKPPILDPPLLDLKLVQECKSEKKTIPQEKPAVEKKTPILEKPNEIKTHLDSKPNVEPKVQHQEKLVEEKIPSQEKIQEKKQTEKPQLTKKPERKPSVEKKVLTDKKNNSIPNKVEKKCKKKVSPKISIAQKPDTGIKQLAKKETQPTKIKHCKSDKKKANKKTCLAVKKEVSTEYPLIRGQPTLKWSNGWSWEGEPFKAKVFLTSDEPVSRTCYPAMRHIEGDVICPRDCILLKSGPRKQQLPFVAKVTAMWENPDDGEMVVSLLWYYRPEHTEQGRLPNHPEDEIFASRHKDTNSVACIEDKCYVLTFNEYCRYKSNMKMLEAGVSHNLRNVVPDMVGDYPRMNRLPKGQVSKDILFFCRRVYDFRQKRLLKNP
ncbi:titin-like [Cimex lectularius]|uniref:BAH domain-containing protein n=1 Tax=Cimex lectularius TaxID=79782 RepID=A0A8I6REP6_CIMLE|nr:titin-like [Cimex lectularius]